MIYADRCRLEDNNIYRAPNELESILASFYFNPRDFLENIYNIKSFDEAIYWTLENDYLPFDTIKRINNCAWRVYGSNIEELSTQVQEYYYDISKEHWMWDYIKVIRNKYSFDFVTNKKSNVDTADQEIYDLILRKYYTYDFFLDTLKRFVYEYQDEWDTINSYYRLLKNFIFERLVKKIEADLNESN